jgi:hypothetical protein
VDDYFLYSDKKKTATFQVSISFGQDLKSILDSQGIDTKKMVLRNQDVVKAQPSIPRLFRKSNIVGVIEQNTEIDLGALSNFVVTSVIKVATAGTTLAGLASCNIM